MTARIGAPKTGGRRKGSLDKNERALITGEMASDLLAVYRKLGGQKWLLQFAKDCPKEFLQQGLSRLFPAPQKDDETGNTFNQQINFNSQDTFEAARRIAFAMNAGLAAQRDLAIEAEVTPQQACDWRAPVGEVAPLVQPEPTEDLDRQRWVEELPLTPEQRADQALTRETRESSIATYAGTPGEQGGSTPSASRQRDPRASARDKMLARRRDELL